MADREALREGVRVTWRTNPFSDGRAEHTDHVPAEIVGFTEKRVRIKLLDRTLPFSGGRPDIRVVRVDKLDVVPDA